ncbi:MAG: O-phospho-L-seryl-tRNA:Cys-tRNA synthase [Methanothrix sp.]|jgi:Sep-tRNA:Cys-tRNA synthetase|uniref:O-phospho-L-seryl-tRNA:Cys-tRNA synthase n=1 Tax=Methanothrix harundinacea TaxID=301375 RepID=A0A101IHF9_9EURY|nr:MAG: cysteine--tRNA ligase [Methanosaeta sp. SDB]KUK43739.1 MAG: O-phospho-L-seryl-tRNA:Cys-tRNA synthase [Methanothrix harundinacea]MDD2637763.1 O-phospho-L-seryl-tRNA:Cys-tRNA synthase [Methanothrix sp.]MDI9399263.1 O-phospho-L-seryl-tRNA:Cys-tRNA synthase [Euryarchaeota archaeon]KUK95251.1 MAG: O-phospho-L-seryl-tRNA:Cys-tRNA synthase [Methanothrix harundinacea]
MLDNLDKFTHLKRGTAGAINIDPLQRGGILTPEAREAIMEWADGYSVCDFCTGSLEGIQNPPIKDFVHEALPEFLEVDQVRITHGAREGMFAAMHSLCKRGSTVVADGNAHYTTLLAAELAGLKVELVSASEKPDYRVDPNGYEEAICRVRGRGEEVDMAVLTYPDGNYGNLVDARAVSEICHREEIPMMLNGAYSVGRMDISAERLGADVIVGSGHKSMASSGPIGVLGASEEHGSRIFRRSKLVPNKELEMLGCTLRGAGVLTMMASFPAVVERTKHWDEEVEKARWFAKEMEELGMTLVGDRPHGHDLMFFKSDVLYEISQTAKKGRYFLYRELKKRKIFGIKPGLTRQFKLSTYLLSREELETVLEAFEEIVALHPKA